MFPIIAICVVGGSLIYLGVIHYRYGEDVLGRAFLPTLLYAFGGLLFVFGLELFFALAVRSNANNEGQALFDVLPAIVPIASGLATVGLGRVIHVLQRVETECRRTSDALESVVKRSNSASKS